MNQADNKIRYFASANGRFGFRNSFDAVISSETLERIYILLGGPGTGKSMLMKKVAAAAEAGGRTCEYIHCSSDTDSLDGILLDGTVAVVDGTAPHARSAVYPGACETTVDLGQYWDKTRLAAERSTIKTLTDEKRRAYARAYAFLASAGSLGGELCTFGERILLREKMERAAARIFKRFPDGRSYRASVRLIDANAMQGHVVFDTPRLLAKTHYLVRDKTHTAHAFLAAVHEQAKRHGHAVVLSPAAIDEKYLVSVFLPEFSIAFTIGEGESERTVNMERFVDRETLRSHKNKLKFAEKCLRSMYDGAFEALGDVKRAHFKLEEIYSAAMDFAAVDEVTSALLTELGL